MDKLRAMATSVVRQAERTWRKLRTQAHSAPQGDRHHAERGQGLAEYALILALIAIVAIASLTLLGLSITGQFWDPIAKDFGEVLSRIGI